MKFEETEKGFRVSIGVEPQAPQKTPLHALRGHYFRGAFNMLLAGANLRAYPNSGADALFQSGLAENRLEEGVSPALKCSPIRIGS